MKSSNNYIELKEDNLKLTPDSVIDMSMSDSENNVQSENTVINRSVSENESVRPFDFTTLYRSPEFQDRKRKFEIELLDFVSNNDFDDNMYSFGDKAFSEFYDQYGIAATETLNGLIVKNLHNPKILAKLLQILSSVDYDRIYSFGQSLLIGVIFLYKEKEDVEITDLVIRCIENWKSEDFVAVLQNIDSKINFLRLYKRKVLEQLTS